MFILLAIKAFQLIFYLEESQGKEHLMFTDDDQYCYDFDDDLDELFNLAIYLINTNPMAELNSVSHLIV